ncbi:MAG: ABC transporter ATP-binding protein [Butyricicoccus sp.]|nr:ABC transporter ATP-binding protein [Butyricicoccus sp.]
MLEFRDVSFQYEVEDFDIIDHLSFHIEPGEFVSVIGPSGCGKSTIFRLTNQLLARKGGDILVDGQSIDGRRGYCGYMPQRDLLFPWRTVADNLRLPMEIQGKCTRAEMDERIQKTLDVVGLTGWGDKRPSELSGGMRQRAAFARTLLTGSELLLLDEPFSALDFLTRISMQEWLLGQWEHDHKTVLFITHDVEEAIFLSGRVLVVEDTPIRKLRSFPVPAAYPRTRECLTHPDMLTLREQLIDMLRREVDA